MDGEVEPAGRGYGKYDIPDHNRGTAISGDSAPIVMLILPAANPPALRFFRGTNALQSKLETTFQLTPTPCKISCLHFAFMPVRHFFLPRHDMK